MNRGAIKCQCGFTNADLVQLLSSHKNDFCHLNATKILQNWSPKTNASVAAQKNSVEKKRISPTYFLLHNMVVICFACFDLLDDTPIKYILVLYRRVNMSAEKYHMLKCLEWLGP